MSASGGCIVEADGDGIPREPGELDLVGVETVGLGRLGDNELAIFPVREETDLINDLPAAIRVEECLFLDCCW